MSVSTESYMVYELLSRRAPHLKWSLRRVAQAVSDHPGIPHLQVAGKAADWLAHQGTRAQDGHGTLRDHFLRAQERFERSAQHHEVFLQERSSMSIYDSYENAA